MTAGASLETGALLAIMDQAGIAVATLTEGLEHDELLRSKLTRAEVLRQLRLLAGSAQAIGAHVRQLMPEVDWSGWEAIGRQLALPPRPAQEDAQAEALWFACESLVPATLLWLRVHRKDQGQLFQMTL